MELDYTRLPPGLQKKTDQACSLSVRLSCLSCCSSCPFTCPLACSTRKRKRKSLPILLHHHLSSSPFFFSFLLPFTSSRSQVINSNLAVSSCSASEQPSPFSNPLSRPLELSVFGRVIRKCSRPFGENSPSLLSLSLFSLHFCCVFPWPGIVYRPRIHGIEEVSLSLHLRPRQLG